MTAGKNTRGSSRRAFLGGLGVAAAAPYFVASGPLGAAGKPAPSERVTMACIGVGGQGSGNMGAFLGDSRVQMVAVCDVDAAHREGARRRCGLPPSAAYGDFRQVVARDDIDALMIATPDHWHAIIVAQAARAGKDLYCEKPLSRTIAEGQIARDTVLRYERVFTTGTWRRSRAACRHACELVRNGRIGRVHTVRVGVPQGFALRGGVDPKVLVQPVPPGLDYDMWLGPAPWAPYTAARCHFNFRWILDYSPGYITDWGAHYLDVAHWGIGADRTGPVRIEGTGEFPRDGLYDAPVKFEITYTYADGVRVILLATPDSTQWGIRFEGPGGWVFVESGSVASQPASIAQEKIGPGEIRLYDSPDHHRNFIDCVLSRKATAAPVEVAHRSTSICHLGFIAVWLGHKLQWDPSAERFVGDETADRMLARTMRSPWHL